MTTTPVASSSSLPRASEPQLLAATTTVEHRSRTAAVHLSGELCTTTAPRLRRLLGELLELGPTSVVVDLSQLQLCTSHGIDVLDQAARQLAATGGRLRILGASGIVRKVLDIAGVEHEAPR